MTSGSLSSSANRSASSVVNRRSTSRSVRRYSSTVVILVLVHNGDRGPLRRAPFALSGQLRAEWLRRFLGFGATGAVCACWAGGGFGGDGATAAAAVHG